MKETSVANAVDLRDFNPYEVGETFSLRDPAKETYRNMLHLVAYDIREPSRLRRVARVCEDYGIRVEYSVFECDLSEDSFRELWVDLHREIDPDEDAILAYRICGTCIQKIKSMGSVSRPEKVLLYFV